MEHSNKFNSRAIKILSYIATMIEELDIDVKIDVDFQSDILSLTTDKGEYIINKHSAAQQIWLASPKSGPYHFSEGEGGKWLNKDNKDLFSILNEELKEYINLELKYE